MENTDYTQSKKTSTSSLSIYLNEIDSQSFDSDFLANHFDLTDDRSKAKIIISKEEDLYSLSYFYNNNFRVIRAEETNIKQTLAQLSRLLSRTFREDIKSVLSYKAPKLPKDFWDNENIVLNHLNTLMKGSEDLNIFIKNLFEINQLKNFKTIHLFVHEKGLGQAQHKQITRQKLSASFQNMIEFTNLFNSIKKSKNRSFGQATLKASTYDIIGTCLAHELLFDNFNVIFLISKDDFLPQTNEDIIFFNKFIGYLKPYLNFFLNHERSKQHITTTKNFLKNILSFLGERMPTDLDSNIEQLLSDLIYAIEQIKNKSFNTADVNHQERIMLLGELLNTLRHELSNPLFGMQLTTELLLDEIKDDELQEFIKEILVSIQRSQNILSNFSQIYSLSPDLEQLDLIHLIREVFTLSKSETKSIQKIIAVNDKPISNEGATYNIVSNQTWLAQILFNLIINSAHALKSAQIQGPEIKINIYAENDQIYINIKDNGPGISPELAKKIFIPFFTTKKEGTGLGLPIIKSLVSKLRGNIELIPNDKGAEFLLVLPNENPDR